MTERLCKNIVLQLIVISYMEEYFSAYLLCKEALLENYSEFQFGHMRKISYTFGLFTSASDYGFKTFRFVFFAASFDAIFCDSPFFLIMFFSKLYLKAIGFSKYN